MGGLQFGFYTNRAREQIKITRRIREFSIEDIFILDCILASLTSLMTSLFSPRSQNLKINLSFRLVEVLSQAKSLAS